jgi:hypothetical protein
MCGCQVWVARLLGTEIEYYQENHETNEMDEKLKRIKNGLDIQTKLLYNKWKGKLQSKKPRSRMIHPRYILTRYKSF